MFSFIIILFAGIIKKARSVGFSVTSIWITFYTSIVSTMSNSQLLSPNSNSTYSFAKPKQLHQQLKFS